MNLWLDQWITAPKFQLYHPGIQRSIPHQLTLVMEKMGPKEVKSGEMDAGCCWLLVVDDECWDDKDPRRTPQKSSVSTAVG